MKKLLILSFFFLSLKIYSQDFISLQNTIVSKFIDKNLINKNLIKNNVLYIFGDGTDFTYNNISVRYLTLSEVKKIVKKKGEFHLICLDELMIRNDKIQTEFIYLIAKKKGKSDFIRLEDFNEIYCIKYDEDIKTFKIYYCY